MRVYYFTADEFALSNIINKRVKISLLNDLNDPYELLGVDLSDKAFRQAFKAGREAAASDYGVICFSKSWKNPLMWAHYGNKHKGVCLGFDIANKYIEEIEYIPELMQPDVDMRKEFGGLEERFFKKLFNMKYEGWKYEEEVRLIVPLEERHSSGYYFTDFEGNMILKEIILGPRCTTKIEDVKKHLCGYTEQISVFKSRIAFKKYEVVTNRNVTKYIHKA